MPEIISLLIIIITSFVKLFFFIFFLLQVIPIEDEYVIGKEIGRGRFSVVCQCVHKVTKKQCAVKIIDKASIEPDEKQLLRTEIAGLFF